MFKFFSLWYKIVSLKYKCVFPTAICVETHSLRAYSHSALAMSQCQYLCMPHLIRNVEKDSQDTITITMLNVNMTQHIKKPHSIVATQFCLSPHGLYFRNLRVLIFQQNYIFLYFSYIGWWGYCGFFVLFVASRYCVCVRRKERDTSKCARQLLPFVPSLEDGR